MTRPRTTKHALHPAIASALRMMLAFVLAFSGTYGVQTALASDDASTQLALATQDEGSADAGNTENLPQPADNPDPDPQPSPTPDPQPQPDPTPQPNPEPGPSPTVYVTDLGLYIKPITTERIDVLAYHSAGIPEAHQEITEKGGSIDFDAVAFWNDGSSDFDWNHVTWTLEPGGEEVASITRDTGLLKARGGKNGTVVVNARVDDGYTQDNMEMIARIIVDIRGQQDVPFVTGIVICDDTGTPIDPSYTFHDVSLSTAVLELRANVTVHDPVSGQDAVYQVMPGAGLSSQTGGAIADLTWYSTEGSFGVVSEDGIYRPLKEATNLVYAQSDAGLDGAIVAASAVIIMPGEGEAHPQDSLTVNVVWEAVPDQVVSSKTFSVADMEALGTPTVTYTAFGGVFGFMTFTGRGPYLADVLAAAGVDTSGGVKELRIESFDNPYVVSWDLLVGKNRYYFPNMDIGSEAEAVQVAPMIAIDSMRAPLGTSDPVPDADLKSDDRFRLLFGSGSGDEGFTTTSMQRYWIHTINVVLTGAPPVEPEPPEEPEKPEEPQPEPQPQPNVIAGGTAGGSGKQDGQPTPPAGATAGPQGEKRHNKGAWSVLQAVSNNQSDVDGLDFDNPLGPFSGAFGVGCLAAGCVEAFVRFRWQTRMPPAQE